MVLTAISPPSVAFCSRYTEMIVPSPRILSHDEWENMGQKHTVASILRMSPAISETMALCWLRNTSEASLVHWQHEKACYDYFRIRKFYMQDSVCYQFHLKETAKLDVSKVAHSIYFGNSMYAIYLNKTFNRSHLVTPIIFDGRGPFISRLFAPVLLRTTNPGIESDVLFNYLTLTYSWSVYQLLGYPYATKCIKGGGSARCIRNCFIDGYRDRLGKIPFTEIVFEDDNFTDFHHVTYSDLKNEDVWRVIEKIEEDCRRQCAASGCYHSIMTTIAEIKTIPSDEYIAILVTLPQRETTSIVHEPRINLIEFLLMLLNSFGTWLGLSILSFNTFGRQRKKKQVRRQLRKLLAKVNKIVKSGNRVGVHGEWTLSTS